MVWIVYALLCAVFLSTSDVFAKKALQEVDEYCVALGRLLWAAPFLFCTLPVITIPELSLSFWLPFACLMPIEITAIVLYTRAIKLSPLSLTTPFLGLTPVFLIVTSFIMLGEVPDKSGLAGIVLVACGAYTLNVRKKTVGLIEPIRAVVRERGSMLMVIVAFLYSITSILGKMCAQHSSPVFFSIIYASVVPFLLFPLAYRSTSTGQMKKAFLNVNFVLLGVFYALSLVCHLNAVVLTKVPYMIAVKRTSLIISIVYGRLVFKEAGFSERVLGGLVMLAGIVLIVVL